MAARNPHIPLASRPDIFAYGFTLFHEIPNLATSNLTFETRGENNTKHIVIV